MAIDRLLQLYLKDIDTFSQWSTYYTGLIFVYFPFYILKWVVLFLPIFILAGGIYGFRYRSSQNSKGQE